MLEWLSQCLIDGYKDSGNNTITYSKIIEKIKSKYKSNPDVMVDKFNNILVSKGYSQLIEKK